ncbi:MAG TPA: sugar ABC transporter substrate-binding protein [Firmicutes bacterium]|nr:sugar ABC transporter substrate-binding protein [Bacillota bacterium]
MIKRLVVLMLFCSVILSAHGASAATNTLTLMLYSDGDKKYFAPSIERFERDHPGVKVDVIMESANYQEKVLTMVATGVAPDVVTGSSDGNFLEWLLDGVVIDVAPYVERDAAFFKDWIPEYRLRTYYKGRSFGVAHVRAGLYPLWFNRRLFDAAGVSYPNGEWTWDAFLQAASKMSIDTNGDGQKDQYGWHHAWKTWVPFLYNGGGGIQDPNDPGKILLDSQATIEALAFLQDMDFKYGASTPNHNFNGSRANTAFFNGKAAMIIRSVSLYGGAPEHMKDGQTLGLALAPKAPNGKSHTMITIGAFGITKASKNKELAWELIKYMVDEESQRYHKVNTGCLTTNHKINQEYFPSGLPVWNHDKAVLQMVQLPMFTVDYMMPTSAITIMETMVNAVVNKNEMSPRMGIEAYMPLIKDAMQDFLAKL